jgi:transcriptional regulator with XRE-family HTH domain
MKVSPVHVNRFRQVRRHQTSYSLADVAFLLGTRSAAAISRWETGAQQPSLINALKLCYVLKRPVQDLLPALCEQARKEVEEKEAFFAPDGTRPSRFRKVARIAA